MNEKQKKFLNALNILFLGNPEAVIKIINFISSPEQAFNITRENLQGIGFKEETISNFLKKQQKINIEKEWQKLEKERVRAISKEDKEYPKLLKEIAKPPVLLYIKGNLLKDEKYLASVGTRWPSDYGRMATPDLVGDLSEEFTIISGMARGIDSLSHRAAIDRDKRTVAVVGTGLDVVFPPENKNLAKEIEKKGAAISEFPLGTPALPYNFPLRNRIIAGMSVGTLVVEAKMKSGALITARIALEEGREVFAVPGPIFSKTSEGTNNLIKQGARLVNNANDVLSIFELEKAVKGEKEIKGETREEVLILEVLKKDAFSTDEIVQKTKLDVAKISSTLILMEIKGKVKRSGNRYCISF